MKRLAADKTQHHIIVTGEAQELGSRLPSSFPGRPIEVVWNLIPVIEFRKIELDSSIVQSVCEGKYNWILFTSPRSVRFWTETLLSHATEIDPSIRIAVVGKSTGEHADLDGFTPEFCPTTPGSEGFLKEFSEISKQEKNKTLFLPNAKEGRKLIAQTLQQWGWKVHTTPIYQTLPRRNIHLSLTSEKLANASAMLFTSPSSVKAVLSQVALPKKMSVFCMGHFTAQCLSDFGLSDHRILPDGSFQRIGELLC